MFEASIENYHDRALQFLKFPNGGILFRTMDICLITGISGRDGGHLGPYLNLDSAVSIAAAMDKEFAAWLVEKFAGYESSTEELDDRLAWSMNVPDEKVRKKAARASDENVCPEN